MITLKPIGHHNWQACLALEVAPEQRRFVNPNIFSLAEAYAHSPACPEDAEEYYRCLPFCICYGTEPVGFAMVTYERECDADGKSAYEIYRLMIDQRHQGKGYGREALRQLLAYAASAPCGAANCVQAQWHPENAASAALFASMGFTVTGQAEDGAVFARKLFAP